MKSTFFRPDTGGPFGAAPKPPKDDTGEEETPKPTITPLRGVAAMQFGPPICVVCVHLHPMEAGPGMTCDAFPQGIPASIRRTTFDHTKPYAGDNGIQFAPRDEKAERDAQLILRVARRAGILGGTGGDDGGGREGEGPQHAQRPRPPR